jgi:hypothetical protein
LHTTLKYLRIAVTALNLTACVLLIALWVRSYRWIDMVDAPLTATRGIIVGSSQGRLSLGEATRPHWLPRRLLSAPYEVMHDKVRAEGVPEELMPIVIPALYGFGGPSVSHSIPILLFGVSGTLLYIGPSLRRFSLRTLLIVTTLVAVALLLIVVSM